MKFKLKFGKTHFDRSNIYDHGEIAYAQRVGFNVEKVDDAPMEISKWEIKNPELDVDIGDLTELLNLLPQSGISLIYLGVHDWKTSPCEATNYQYPWRELILEFLPLPQKPPLSNEEIREIIRKNEKK